MPPFDPTILRQRLDRARLLLIFSPPSLAEGLAVLEQVMAQVDIIQVRPKGQGQGPCTPARARDWARAVLELTGGASEEAPLVMVNDCVDVAALLKGEGVVGVHLGQDDCPAKAAREFLGPESLIGLSTHTTEQVAAAWDEPIDYLGFGPVFSTATKDAGPPVGPDRAWIAAAASTQPLFPIGGIHATSIAELARIGRAAVSSAIMGAEDPCSMAKSLRALLEPH